MFICSQTCVSKILLQHVTSVKKIIHYEFIRLSRPSRLEVERGYMTQWLMQIDCHPAPLRKLSGDTEIMGLQFDIENR
jgi:hypothetical protein